MMKNKILSISVAAYNVENVLGTCLDSLAQSRYLDDIEVLVINDGSKDNTEVIARKYQDKYPNSFFLVNKENGGHGSTINESIKRAHGKYFKVLDGDDWVDVKEFDGFIEDLFKCEADLMVNDYNEVYVNKNIRRKIIDAYDLNNKYDIKDMDSNNIVPMHSITVRTDKLQQHKFRMSEHRFYADTEYIFFVLSVVNNFQVSNKCVYQYRLGREGQSVSPDCLYNHIEDMLYIESRLIRECMSRTDHSNISLLKSFVQEKYMTTFYMFLLMSKNDKIYKLREFDKNMREKYPEFINEIPLGKYDLAKYNYSFFMNLYRVLHRIRLRLSPLKAAIICLFQDNER